MSLGLNDDLVVIGFPALFEGLRSVARPRIDIHTPVESITIPVDDPIPQHVEYRRGQSTVLQTYRPQSPDRGPFAPTSASSWMDIRTTQATLHGWEHAGTTEILWAEIEPLWHALVDSIVPALSSGGANLVSILRAGADLQYECSCDQLALDRLRHLVRQRTTAT